jgi:curved DNA-binding protein CbpA
MNPYTVLGVAPSADDAEIRQAYLQGVRLHTPERDPDRFQALTNAYQKVATRQNRLEHFLFDASSEGASPLGALAAYCKQLPPPAPRPTAAMLNFLRECSKT